MNREERIKVKLKTMIILFSLLLISFSVSADGSLWSDNAADMYKDRPEYEIGDIITVVIQEDANAVQSANTSTSQESEIEAGSGIGIFDFIKAFGLSFSDGGSANGQTERSGTLQADITTQISEVMSNGNLKILGLKKIKINGEEQIIKLSGIIRPEDITIDNTISSKKVAEARIEYEGKGIVADKQNPGLIERIFNFIF